MEPLVASDARNHISSLLIGKLANETGCSVETIRYYGQIGLLCSPPRTSGGHRIYNYAHVRDLQFTQFQVAIANRKFYL